MKRLVLIIAAALLLGMTACQKENIQPINNNGRNVMVKSTSDLIGTSWTYTHSDTIIFDIDSIQGIIINYEFSLYFDSTYAHLSFPNDISIRDMMENESRFSLEEIESMNFAYSYDPATLSGHLSANTYNEEGIPISFQLPFTYDSASDAIVIPLTIATDGDTTDTITLQLIFHRHI